MHAGHCEEVVHHWHAGRHHKSKHVSRRELLGLCWFAIRSRNTETVRQTDVMDLMFRRVFFYLSPLLAPSGTDEQFVPHCQFLAIGHHLLQCSTVCEKKSDV